MYCIIFRLQNCLWIIKMSLTSVNLTCKISHRNLKPHKNICKKLNCSLFKKSISHQLWKVLRRSFMMLPARFVRFYSHQRKWIRSNFFGGLTLNSQGLFIHSEWNLYQLKAFLLFYPYFSFWNTWRRKNCESFEDTIWLHNVPYGYLE